MKIRTGDILTFFVVARLKGHAFVSWRNVKRNNKWVFRNGGFSCKKCEQCHTDLVIGMDCEAPDGSQSVWVDHCVACGHTVLESPIYAV